MCPNGQEDYLADQGFHADERGWFWHQMPTATSQYLKKNYMGKQSRNTRSPLISITQFLIFLYFFIFFYLFFLYYCQVLFTFCCIFN